MKKRLTTFIWLLMAFGIQSQAQVFESATDAVKNMGVGWNLGNTLDANGTGISDVVQSETYWGQPVTKPELITMMKEAGFAERASAMLSSQKPTGDNLSQSLN